MKKVGYAGTFDPITNGHLWVIEEGLNIADEVIVMIAHNPTKKTLFTELERKEMIDNVLKERKIDHKVKTIVVKNEYIAQSAVRHGCSYLLRGIRKAGEFDYENLIQTTNTEILMGAKTLFVMPPSGLASVSSSYVKNLINPVGWHWNVKKLVPAAVYEKWLKKYITDIVNKHVVSKELSDENKKMLLNKVFISYLNGDRYYHNLEHIAHCLQELEWALSNYNLEQDVVENLVLAILSHDIVYNSMDKSSSDEEKSALWFIDLAKKIGLDKTKSDKIANMVRATAYLSNPKNAENKEEELLCSIDLAILAQPTNVYNWYTEMVRNEYSFVTDEKFVEGRIQALEKILLRKVLFMSSYFEHYEERARTNLINEIKELKEKKDSLKRG